MTDLPRISYDFNGIAGRVLVSERDFGRPLVAGERVILCDSADPDEGLECTGIVAGTNHDNEMTGTVWLIRPDIDEITSKDEREHEAEKHRDGSTLRGRQAELLYPPTATARTVSEPGSERAEQPGTVDAEAHDAWVRRARLADINQALVGRSATLAAAARLSHGTVDGASAQLPLMGAGDFCRDPEFTPVGPDHQLGERADSVDPAAHVGDDLRPPDEDGRALVATHDEGQVQSVLGVELHHLTRDLLLAHGDHGSDRPASEEVRSAQRPQFVSGQLAQLGTTAAAVLADQPRDLGGDLAASHDGGVPLVGRSEPVAHFDLAVGSADPGDPQARRHRAEADQ